MKPPLEDYRNEVLFQVGQRVWVRIPTFKRRFKGTIVAIRTDYAGTPNMRRIVYRIQFDKPIRELSGTQTAEVFQKQLSALP